MGIQQWLLREKKKTHYQRLHQTIAQEQQFQVLADLLQNGCAELGWDGDPWLKIVYNKMFDRLEVVDTHPKFGGQYDTVFVTQPGDASIADPYSLIRRVKMCDQRYRTVDEFLNMLDQQQEDFEKAQAAEDEALIGDAPERLAAAIQKDLGPYYGGLSRRYF